MSTLRFPGAYNGFIPAATGVVIGYIRDAGKFKINDYCQYIKAPARLGVYGRLELDEQARMVTTADFLWADGADRPSGNTSGMRFKWEEFQTQRYAPTGTLGDMAMEGAKDTWDPLLADTKALAQKMMTLRTYLAITELETVANWEGNVASANDLNGGAGTWDQASDDPASDHYNAISRSLLEAANRIAQATNSVVQPEDLSLILSPTAALRMAKTPEIHDYVKYGPFARDQRDKLVKGNWGLPPMISGIKVVVEDCVRVSSRPKADGTASSSRAYIKNDTSAILASVKGGVQGAYKQGSYATFQIFHVGAMMQVEAFSDPKNRRIDFSCVEEVFPKLVQPQAGYLITGILPG